MKNYGRASTHEFLGDRIVFRNLAPQDCQLPGLDEIRPRIGLPGGRIPRKHELDYARVIGALLKHARAIDSPSRPIRRLVFVGDTRLLDGTAFANLCQVEGWDGLAFIGAETSEPAVIQIAQTENGQGLYLANRWAALEEFDAFCTRQGLPIDEDTAVILDIDKTVLGARGRNAGVIDGARSQAVQETVASLLGRTFDSSAFQKAYSQFNQVEFHPFTSDNQDYVAYVCLILGSGLYAQESVVSRVRQGQLASFEQFIAEVEARKVTMPAELREIHAQIFTNVQAGDPTPFKAFRRNEYRATIRKMGCLPEGAPVEKLLAEEILLTQEVRCQAQAWKLRGALLFGLSDKPDEAALPTPELAAQGYPPLHQAVTHAVGE